MALARPLRQFRCCVDFSIMAGRDGTNGATSSDENPFWGLVAGARRAVNRFVWQIDEEQEARMRAYLDETYGGADFEGRPQRGVMLDSLRRV